MIARPLTPAEFADWDAFVEKSENGTAFHSSRWLQAVSKDFVIYAGFSGDRIVAGLPVARTRRHRQRIVQQPPLTPHLGVVWAPQSTKPVGRGSMAKEVTSALAAAVVHDHDAVTINFTPGWNDLQGFMWRGFSTAVRYTYLLPLANLPAAWENMDARRRNDIRRAEKDGVTIRQGGDHEQLLRLVGTTFSRQGLTPRFFEVARRIHAVANSAQFTAFQEGDESPVAAVYLVWDQHRAYYLLGGYDETRAHGGAHALAMWRAIEFAAGLGITHFDFEGSQVPQVEAYFRKFGGDLTPYYSVSWASARARLVGDAMGVVRRLVRPFRRS